MKTKILKYVGLPLLVFVALNCAVITVNVYFPTEALEEAAGKIIDEIESTDENQSNSGNSDQQSFFKKTTPFNIFGGQTVFADEINLNLTTPAIRNIIDKMKGINNNVMKFKDNGVFGECSDGTISMHGTGGLSGKDISTAKKLLKAENSYRNTLYKELAKANKIEESNIGKIKTIFFQKRKAKAKKGHWFKDQSGKWTQK